MHLVHVGLTSHPAAWGRDGAKARPMRACPELFAGTMRKEVPSLSMQRNWWNMVKADAIGHLPCLLTKPVWGQLCGGAQWGGVSDIAC